MKDFIDWVAWRSDDAVISFVGLLVAMSLGTLAVVTFLVMVAVYPKAMVLIIIAATGLGLAFLVRRYKKDTK